MKTYTLLIIYSFLFLVSCNNANEQKIASTTEVKETVTEEKTNTKTEDLKIIPIMHATAILEYKGLTIYIDPTGGVEAFKNQKEADLVLITDIHGDHMNIKTLDKLDLSKASMIVPEAVAEKLSASYSEQLITLNNGKTKEFKGITIEAIPMYNLREEALKYHSKGRGNGYLLTLGEERIYFSGDTEDISEMRALQNIDKAFVCMNLPYTMTVESAADAVLAFKPKQVYPYHYRGTEGLSDVAKFKEIVNTGNAAIEIIQLDWYPAN